MCGQKSNSHLNLVVKPVCLPIFCCRIFILFAIWHPKSWFKAVCDQKSLILCRYRTRTTLNNRVMWTVSDLSLPVSIASRFPPGPLEAECPIIPPLTIHQFIPLSIHPYPCMNARTDIMYRCPCFPLCYGWRVGIVYTDVSLLNASAVTATAVSELMTLP